MSSLSSLWSELRRRNVVKAGGAYVAGAWIFYQVIDALMPLVGAPDWVPRAVVVLLATGLPFLLAFAWAFELTPEGLKRTEDVDPAVSQTRATGRKIQYLLIGLLAAAVIGLFAERSLSTSEAITAYGPGETLPVELSEDVEAVVVMPFTTSGPDTDVWREGMVSMLTTNLDGLGSLRAIDKRTVLARWRERVPEGGEADLATTLDAARATQAAVAVVGDVVSVGMTMRITATVYDTGSGATLGRLQAEGDAEDFLALIDQITVQVVEAARRGGERRDGDALPVPDLSALTTGSLPALRAYLEGERLLRQSRFEQAIGPLERAVALDSTFAMAHLRLADAYTWTAPAGLSDWVAGGAAIRTHIRAAARHGSRLPPREAALLKASIATTLDAAPPRAGKVLRAAVERFPTDPELWARYADVIGNPVVADHVGAPPIEGAVAAARQALALDSTMTPAYSGLIVPAIAQGDTAEARRLLAAYARHAGRGSASRVVGSYAAALDLASGDSAKQAAVLQGLQKGTLYLAFTAYALGLRPNASALQAHAQLGRLVRDQYGLYSYQMQAWLFGGRHDTLRAFIRDTTRTSLSAQVNRLVGAAVLVGRGALAAASVPAGLAREGCRPEAEGSYRLWGCYHQARLSALRHAAGVPGDHGPQAEAARSVIEASAAEFKAGGEPELARWARGFRQLLDGQAALAAGEPAAHDTLDAAHRNLASFAFSLGWWEPMEGQVRALMESGETDRALRYAAIIATRDPYGDYLAGRAHEAGGDAEAARTAYEQFVSAWQGADPDAPALLYAKAYLAGEEVEAPAL